MYILFNDNVYYLFIAPNIIDRLTTNSYYEIYSEKAQQKSVYK